MVPLFFFLTFDSSIITLGSTDIISDRTFTFGPTTEITFLLTYFVIYVFVAKNEDEDGNPTLEWFKTHIRTMTSICQN